ncbi:hypothetical protein IB238_22445 [Rhizobium sp. ARZ01]|uniref:hypothetical protein n=1 Tax=Rhizobium sp. ARZ01 TaxID=2769313 RepID=UPI0017859AA6|nr:hypothetical protein [Rhizobium sp. ARZ01]MBD9375385.1 hypothetical protein [Rhizobium sp. ARZ01]
MSAGRLLPVSLISAATLAYEVLLMRLLSIIQWHQFAYMIISIALLGFGASGTFVALARRPLVKRYPAVFAASAALFGITAVASFAGAERLPFFFGATCIGLAFSRHPDQIGRVYAFDLVGAGVGALGIVGLLFLVFPSAALRFVAALDLQRRPSPRRAWLAIGGSLRAAAALEADGVSQPGSHLALIRRHSASGAGWRAYTSARDRRVRRRAPWLGRSSHLSDAPKDL